MALRADACSDLRFRARGPFATSFAPVRLILADLQGRLVVTIVTRFSSVANGGFDP
jgi:hypothetical protein